MVVVCDIRLSYLKAIDSWIHFSPATRARYFLRWLDVCFKKCGTLKTDVACSSRSHLHMTSQVYCVCIWNTSEIHEYLIVMQSPSWNDPTTSQLSKILLLLTPDLRPPAAPKTLPGCHWRLDCDRLCEPELGRGGTKEGTECWDVEWGKRFVGRSGQFEGPRCW